VKHRSQAQALIADGCVRVNKTRAAKASQQIGNGDILTLVILDKLRVIRVTGESPRRVSPALARELFEEIPDMVQKECEGEAILVDR
jgi:ribosomal 50S subunit-recycling heat shock protein